MQVNSFFGIFYITFWETIKIFLIHISHFFPKFHIFFKKIEQLFCRASSVRGIGINPIKLPGQLTEKFVSVELSGDNGFAITEDGEGWIWGKNANGELGISDYEPRTKPYPLITMEK